MADSRFTDTLLAWYAEYRRDLPWRRTRDPYPIWLSEVILQQTRIIQGTAYWERFLSRFPDVGSLAGAEEDEVLQLWEGLGYYSRARNLLAAARQIAARGSFPATLAEIRALKGVGDYTAAAIASIAFGIDAAAVDGNVYRVLARYYGRTTPIGTPAARKEFTALSQSLLPPGQAGEFNQAMMDFGALQCTPANPACDACPLSARCAAFQNGRVAFLPVKPDRQAVKTRWFDYIYLRSQGHTAIRKRGGGDIWQGLWEPLCIEYADAARTRSLSGFSRPGSAHRLCRNIKHCLTHQTLLADFYLLETEDLPKLPAGYITVQEDSLGQYGKPRLFTLLLQVLAKEDS